MIWGMGESMAMAVDSFLVPDAADPSAAGREAPRPHPDYRPDAGPSKPPCYNPPRTAPDGQDDEVTRVAEVRFYRATLPGRRGGPAPRAWARRQGRRRRNRPDAPDQGAGGPAGLRRRCEPIERARPHRGSPARGFVPGG